MAIWNNDTEWAPIAEYRGVCLMERPGNVRCAWDGNEYTTDGHVWLWHRRRRAKDMIKTMSFHGERVAKTHLDEVDDPSNEYLSMRECLALMGHPEAVIPAYRWDEQQGVFVNG